MISINILGVTGSIGRSAQQVILHQPERFDVRLVSGFQDVEGLEKARVELDAKAAAREDIAQAVRDAGRVDITLAAISGMAGLEPLMAAIEMSDRVAIANKEPLVAAWPQVKAAAEAHNCTLLPVDSEHNAIYQVFNFDAKETIEAITLTASGGPFREWSYAQMEKASIEDALKHPNWSMGKKITIDSATMMNKALEVIEAAMLFDLLPEKIKVLIHKQSVIHGMVEYCDGSVLAQLGASDMCTPIANILAWPERLESPGGRLDLSAIAQLDFSAPDLEQFPALRLAYEALAMGQYGCIALNAANEVSVQAFLDGQIGFNDIVRINEQVMKNAPAQDGFDGIDDVIVYDEARREDARRLMMGQE
jgi:1-deoxy-D-xylulose-5-phosphate reductoisomerase